MRKRKILNWIIPVITLVFFSCKKSGDDNSEPAIAVAVEHGTTTGQATKKTIGPAGGSIQTPDGNISIEIPAGAVTAQTEFSIQPVTSTLDGSAGTSYRLGPENVHFEKDVKISFKYLDQDLGGTSEDDLYLAYQDEKGFWNREIMTGIDKTNKKLTASTRHFSDWTIERIFYISVDKTTLAANEQSGLLVYMKDCDDKKQIVTKQPVPNKNIDGWFVNGPGSFNRTNMEAVTYTAPASIPAPVEVAVGVRIKNLVSKRNPDRPGNTGLVIVQTNIQLLAEEFFIWEMDGSTNVGLSIDGAMLGTTANILGTGLTGGVTLLLNASKAGSYDLGSAVTPDNFSIQVSVPSQTTVFYQGMYYNCGESVPRYGKGKLTITKFGSIGGMIEGNFTATVYARVDECQNKSKQVTGSFKVKRRA